MSYCLNLDQHRHSADHDLGLNCLQKLPANDKSRRWHLQILWCQVVVIKNCRVKSKAPKLVIFHSKRIFFPTKEEKLYSFQLRKIKLNH